MLLAPSPPLLASACRMFAPTATAATITADVMAKTFISLRFLLLRRATNQHANYLRIVFTIC